VIGVQEHCKRIREWTDNMAATRITEWEQLPDIELYMDQVLTILERQTAPYSQADDIRAMTPSMINNYVKDGTIKRPSNKKYNKEHIANLIMLNSAKQVLPINDISSLLNKADTEITTAEKFEYFTFLQRQACESLAVKMREALANVGDQCDRKQLFILATKLVLEANVMVSASKMLIREVLGPAQAKVLGKRVLDKKAAVK
jgi:hypothetical protein